MTSKCQHGRRRPEEHGEKLKFLQRMDRSTQITSNWHAEGLCGHSVHRALV
jgi:hypothetical protein